METFIPEIANLIINNLEVPDLLNLILVNKANCLIVTSNKAWLKVVYDSYRSYIYDFNFPYINHTHLEKFYGKGMTFKKFFENYHNKISKVNIVYRDFYGDYFYNCLFVNANFGPFISLSSFLKISKEEFGKILPMFKIWVTYFAYNSIISKDSCLKYLDIIYEKYDIIKNVISELDLDIVNLLHLHPNQWDFSSLIIYDSRSNTKLQHYSSIIKITNKFYIPWQYQNPEITINPHPYEMLHGYYYSTLVVYPYSIIKYIISRFLAEINLYFNPEYNVSKFIKVLIKISKISQQYKYAKN